MLKARYFIGVAGGATRCRARLRDASGRMLAQAISPAANIYVDIEAGIATVHDVVNQTLVKAEPSRQYPEEDVSKRPSAPRHDAVEKAILLCGGALPKLDETR